MKQTEQMGMNRTGTQMSPFDSEAMQSAALSSQVRIERDDGAGEDVRSAYILGADGLGSVPVPMSVQGAVNTGLSMLKGNSPQIFIDKLGERLAFERTGTRLYDALITKCKASSEAIGGMTVDDLLMIRQDEAQHCRLVAQAIESLGGDPTAQTPSADLAGVESMGLVQVVNDPRTSVTQSLHAILTAELADQAGWESLIALAEEQGQSSMIDEFSLALDEERDHLQQVQTWYETALGISGGNGAATGAGIADLPA